MHLLLAQETPSILLSFVKSQILLSNTEPAANSSIKYVTLSTGIYANTHSSRGNTQLIKEGNATSAMYIQKCFTLLLTIYGAFLLLT